MQDYVSGPGMRRDSYGSLIIRSKRKRSHEFEQLTDVCRKSSYATQYAAFIYTLHVHVTVKIKQVVGMHSDCLVYPEI